MSTEPTLRRPGATSVFAGMIALAAVGVALPARAGDRLNISQLVERSLGAVVLEVRPGRDKAPDGLKIREVVAGPVDAKMQVPAEWNDDCIPSRTELKRWLSKHKDWPERSLWQKAVRAPRIEALIFVQNYKGQLLPFCELESMELKHTSLHPDYARYVADVKAAWAKRPSAPPPIRNTRSCGVGAGGRPARDLAAGRAFAGGGRP
jgi:hypothetical protein